jgi:hypothetical protein
VTVRRLDVLGLQTGVLGGLREHARADFVAIVDGEHEFGPTLTREWGGKQIGA